MNKTLSCGTVRAGRKNFPAEIFGKDTTKKMNRGELEWRSKGPVSVVTWIDKKPVHVAGTVTKTPGPEEQTTVKRRRKDGEQEDIPCPEIIKEYNQLWVVSTEMTSSSPITQSICSPRSGGQDYFLIWLIVQW